MPQPGQRRRVPKVVLAAIITTVGRSIVALIGLIAVLVQRVPAGPVPVPPSSGSSTVQASVFLSPTAPVTPLPDPYGRKHLVRDDPLVTNTRGRWQVGTSSNQSSVAFAWGVRCQGNPFPLQL